MKWKVGSPGAGDRGAKGRRWGHRGFPGCWGLLRELALEEEGEGLGEDSEGIKPRRLTGAVLWACWVPALGVGIKTHRGRQGLAADHTFVTTRFFDTSDFSQNLEYRWTIWELLDSRINVDSLCVPRVARAQAASRGLAEA